MSNHDEPLEIEVCPCGFDENTCERKRELGGCRFCDDEGDASEVADFNAEMRRAQDDMRRRPACLACEGTGLRWVDDTPVAECARCNATGFVLAN